MEALRKLEGSNFKIVILDVKMPEMDGITVLKKIKKSFPLVEVIMLTGHGTVETAVQGVNLGASNFLLKPADINDITEKVEEALEKRKNIRAKAENKKQHFKKLKIRLAVGLLSAFILPYVLFFLYFQYQFTSSLKNTGKLNLESLSNSEKNTIDLFLQERVVNLFNLFRLDSQFINPPPQSKMDQYLQRLRRNNDAFFDVGFHDETGVQVSYAGPYPDLQGQNYREEKWFKELIDQNRDFFISDIYLGFRNRPHFTIAIKQIIDGKTCVMRSTLDPDKVYMFLRSISRGKSVESTIINREGKFQVVDPERGELLGLSQYIPPADVPSGVSEIISNGDRVLIGHAWLNESSWALLVRQTLKDAYADLYRSRRIMIITLAVFFVIIAIALWFANSRMIDRIEADTEQSQELKQQLFHVSKLASVGQLATGVAHEINNPLAIIVATTGVIKDMLNPEFNLNPTPEAILKEVENIESAAFRARTITRQLLAYGRKNEPVLSPCNINQVLNEITSGIKEREFNIAGIDIVRDYDTNIPDLLLDVDKIRQVFLNLINNAGDAITGSGARSGAISLITQRKEKEIKVIVKDTGPGIPPDRLPDIFNPFFTTKEVGKGTGLGLSISLNIIESLGGTIEVQSIEGAGTQFIVTLPIQQKTEDD